MRDGRLVRDMLQAPRKLAFMLTVGYILYTAAWILFSGDWALTLSDGSVETFKTISRYQDLVFLGTKAIGIYFFSHLVFDKVATKTRCLVQSEELRLEAERKAIPALMAGSVAHDVANLLTVLRFNVERLRQLEVLSPASLVALEKLDRSTDRLTELVQRLRGASKSLLRDRPQRFNFAAAVKDTIEMMELHTSTRTTKVSYVGPDVLVSCGYPILIHQLVMNLVLNAAEATGAGGQILLTAEGVNNGVRLTSEDNGPGIPVNLRRLILGPFFTTKATGSGLGLMSVRSCVEMHEGSLEIGDASLGGAKFTVTLPDLNDARVEELRNPDRRMSREHSLESADL